MSKHIYRTMGVKAANWEWIAEQARTEGRVVYGVDATEEYYPTNKSQTPLQS